MPNSVAGPTDHCDPRIAPFRFLSRPESLGIAVVGEAFRQEVASVLGRYVVSLGAPVYEPKWSSRFWSGIVGGAALATGTAVVVIIRVGATVDLTVPAIAAGAVALLLITTRWPIVGLGIALVVDYNPVFNYLFLYTREFQGGSLRATISLVLLGLVFGGALVHNFRSGRLVRGVRISLPVLAYLMFVGIGLAFGLVQGNDTRLIGSDLFPVVEFFGYLLLTAQIVGSSGRARAVCWIVVIWGGVVALIDDAVYAFNGDQLVSHFALGGTATLVSRLDDFMPALILPVGLALLMHEPARRRQLAIMMWLIPIVIAVALSFFRSLWVGIIVAVLFLIIVVEHRQRATAMVRLGSFATVTAVIMLAAGGLLLGSIAAVHGQSVLDLIAGRVSYLEPTSGGARIEDNLALLAMIRAQPFFGTGLGGEINSFPLFSTSNYYLSMAAELGIFAPLAFVVALLGLLRSTLVAASQAPDRVRGPVLGIVGSFVAMAVTLATFPSVVHYPIPAYLGTFAGCLLVFRRSAATD